MKKMYFLTLLIIITITIGFLFYSTDADTVNRRFLSSYEIKTAPQPIEISEFKIPQEFDKIYEDYNLIQIEAGLDLTPYKGQKAVRYTYKVTNFFDDMPCEVLANVICIKHRPVAGDIICPRLAGFIEPLNFMMDY